MFVRHRRFFVPGKAVKRILASQSLFLYGLAVFVEITLKMKLGLILVMPPVFFCFLYPARKESKNMKAPPLHKTAKIETAETGVSVPAVFFIHL